MREKFVHEDPLPPAYRRNSYTREMAAPAAFPE